MAAAASASSAAAVLSPKAASDSAKDAASSSRQPVPRAAGAPAPKSKAEVAPFWASFRPWKPSVGREGAEGRGSASSSSGPIVDAKGGPDEAGKGKAAELAGTGAAEDVATKPAPKAGARPPGRCALKQGFKGVDKCRARAPRPPTKKRPEDPGVDGEINMSSGRSDSDADGAEDNGGGGRFGGSRWRGGKKTRRLKVGEAGEDAVEDQDDHPDTSLSKEVLAALDLPAADVPADLADEVAKAKAEIRGPTYPINDDA